MTTLYYINNYSFSIGDFRYYLRSAKKEQFYNAFAQENEVRMGSTNWSDNELKFRHR